MRAGQLRVLNEIQALVEPGDKVTEEGIVKGGGYLTFYNRDSLTAEQEDNGFKYCVKVALNIVVGSGSDEAVIVANQWTSLFNSRTFNSG